MRGRQACGRLAGGQLSVAPSGSGGSADLTLFEDGEDGDANLGAAVIFSAQSGHMSAAYQHDDWWMVVVPVGTTGGLHLAGCHTSQLMDEG